MAVKNMITLYTTSNCHFCDSVKEFLKEKKQAFFTVNIEEEAYAGKLLSDKGFRGVPITDINGKFIQGYDKVQLLKALNLE